MNKQGGITTNILGLDEFNVIEGYDSEQYYKFVVEAKEPPTFCTKCGTTAELDENGDFVTHVFKRKDWRPRTVADLDLRGKKVIIQVNQKRFFCPYCGGEFTEYFNMALKLSTVQGQERIVKGHKDCVEEIISIMKDIWGGRKRWRRKVRKKFCKFAKENTY